MDSDRFDRLTRDLATRSSRRRVVRGIAASALALLGIERADARVCASPGALCREHATCCSGRCDRDRSGRRRCQCQSVKDCPAPSGQCQVATCSDGVCGTAIAVGQSCDDGDACTTNDVCQQNGTCVGSRVDCSNLDTQCTQGVCVGGSCQTQNSNEGLSCDDGDACTTGETCQGGVCRGASICPPGDICSNGTCTCTVGGSCATGSFATCGGSPRCLCGTTVEGDLVCFESNTCGTVGVSCTTSAECGGGDPDQRCVVDACACGASHCQLICDGTLL